MKYYRVNNELEKHYTHQYHDGLNIDNITFNTNPKEFYAPGGFHITEIKHLNVSLFGGVWLREVELIE